MKAYSLLKLALTWGINTFLFFSALANLIACSSSREAHIVRLETAQYPNATEQSDTPQLLENTGGVFTSTLRLQEGDLRFHTTRLRECALPTSRSQLSTTRQLLVGFDELTIDSSHVVSLAGTKVTRTFARAKLDTQDLQLIVYSLRENSCVEDFVVWFSDSYGRLATPMVAEKYESYLSNVLSGLPSGKAPAPNSLALDNSFNIAALDRQSPTEISRDVSVK